MVEASSFISEDSRVLFKVVMKRAEKDKPYESPLLIDDIKKIAWKYGEETGLLIYGHSLEFPANLMNWHMPVSLLLIYIDIFKKRRLKTKSGKILLS